MFSPAGGTGDTAAGAGLKATEDGEASDAAARSASAAPVSSVQARQWLVLVTCPPTAAWRGGNAYYIGCGCWVRTAQCCWDSKLTLQLHNMLLEHAFTLERGGELALDLVDRLLLLLHLLLQRARRAARVRSS